MAHGVSSGQSRRLHLGGLVILTGLLLWTAPPSAAQPTGPAAAPPPAAEPPAWLAARMLPPPAERRLGLLETLELALEHDPNIALVEANLDSARGNLEIARSDFDLLLSGDANAGRDRDADPDVEFFDAGIAAGQRLRSGLQISSSVDLSRLAEVGGETANNGALSITLRQPLLRGRGRDVVTTAEQIAEIELVATRDDLEQQVATRLRAIAGFYWSYLSAADNLEILEDTENQSRRFLDNTRRLVDADLTPAADLVQLEANLLSRQLSRRAGERRLVEARQELGREIGLSAEEILALPLPGDPYPPLDPEAAPGLEQVPAYLELARESRADLRGGRRRLEEDRLQLRFLENALKPQLDLLVTPGYANTFGGEGFGDFFSPLFRNLPGLSTTVGLAWSIAPRNRLARGKLAVQEANLRRGELALERIELQIGADLPTAINDLAYSAEQLAGSLEALELFRRALDNEEKKLRAGSSTLIDVLNQQDALIAARQRVNDSRLSLALALLRLRYETGTLIAAPAEDGEPARILAAAFMTLPQLSR